MKIYISGKITGLEKQEYTKNFNDAEKYLHSLGYHNIINPVTINENMPTNTTWNEYMLNDIKYLLDCNAIYMLKGWNQSKGANIEYQIAKILGKQIIFEK